MAELITPESLLNFGGRYVKERYVNTPSLFLGISNLLIISGGARVVLALEDSGENHVIIQEENEKLYIKKADKPDSGTWPVVRYKNNGLRIAKTSLCKFLRNRFSITPSQKVHFVLVEAGELGFEITKPVDKTRKEADRG